ncbi:MAG: serine/threonine-protein kinase [Gemmataceae bacterium]
MHPDTACPWHQVIWSAPSLLSPPAEPGEELPRDLLSLVAAGRLTKFQASVLAAGQGASLSLGNYVLLDQLGEGGMGAVYKARHLRLGKLVAVKIIRKDLLSPTAAKRFVREVRAAAKLDHPLIVRALDADEIGGQHFLAMEYVEGEDLAREVQCRGPFPIAEAAEVTFQITLALQHLYEAGIVHRDLKPTNLIRDRKTGAVKILDLGLARILRRDGEADLQSGSLTQVGSVFGTPDFMAPEQGQAAKLADGRSDLYSLGCVLYFLLTAGAVSWRHGNRKIIRHNTEAPRPVSDFRTDTPPELLLVLNRLLAKNPTARYQTPAELVAALTSLGFTSTVAIPGATSTTVVSQAADAPTSIARWIPPF